METGLTREDAAGPFRQHRGLGRDTQYSGAILPLSDLLSSSRVEM